MWNANFQNSKISTATQQILYAVSHKDFNQFLVGRSRWDFSSVPPDNPLWPHHRTDTINLFNFMRNHCYVILKFDKNFASFVISFFYLLTHTRESILCIFLVRISPCLWVYIEYPLYHLLISIYQRFLKIFLIFKIFFLGK